MFRINTGSLKSKTHGKVNLEEYAWIMSFNKQKEELNVTESTDYAENSHIQSPPILNEEVCEYTKDM